MYIGERSIWPNTVQQAQSQGFAQKCDEEIDQMSHDRRFLGLAGHPFQRAAFCYLDRTEDFFLTLCQGEGALKKCTIACFSDELAERVRQLLAHLRCGGSVLLRGSRLSSLIQKQLLGNLSDVLIRAELAHRRWTKFYLVYGPGLGRQARLHGIDAGLDGGTSAGTWRVR